MDLSTGPDVDDVRGAVLAACSAPVGTVPIYQAAEEVDDFADLPLDAFFDVVEAQAVQGVDRQAWPLPDLDTARTKKGWLLTFKTTQIHEQWQQ
jgi:hypothetical protein